jgi:hypothetical protein
VQPHMQCSVSGCEEKARCSAEPAACHSQHGLTHMPEGTQAAGKVIGIAHREKKHRAHNNVREVENRVGIGKEGSRFES